MTDEAKALVERLRHDYGDWICDEAADLIETQAREIERLRGALGHAVGVIEAHVDRDALGMNGDPETGMWPLLDEYLHHFRAALAKRGLEVREIEG